MRGWEMIKIKARASTTNLRCRGESIRRHMRFVFAVSLSSSRVSINRESRQDWIQRHTHVCRVLKIRHIQGYKGLIHFYVFWFFENRCQCQFPHSTRRLSMQGLARGGGCHLQFHVTKCVLTKLRLYML